MEKITENLERQIAVYENRIKKIEQTPDPSRLKSNRAMYELMRDYNKEMLQHWTEGRPFLVGDAYPPARLLSAMDFFIINPDASAQQRIRRAPEYIDISNSRGFSADCCTSTRAGVGMILAGDVPPPSVIYGDSFCCLPFYVRNSFLVREYNVPLINIDAGYFVDVQGDNYQEAVDYIAAQYEKMLPLLEEVSGVPYNEDKLRELQKHHYNSIRLAVEIQELAKAVPAPIAGRDSLRFYPRSLRNPDRLTQYLEALRDELKERVDAGIAYVPEEKLRFLWLQTPPLWMDTFDFLEERGVAVLTEMGGLNIQRAVLDPIEEWHPEDSPIKQEARWALNFHGYGRAESRVQGVANQCREYKIDGVIHCSQRGCHYYAHTARLIQERVEKELGIPWLTINGDFMDMRDFDESEYYGQLEQFVDLCLNVKGVGLPA